MRIRPAVAALATVAASFAGPSPAAQAAPTAATFTMQLHLDCYGCGSTHVAGTLTCVGPCVLDGVACTAGCAFPVGATAESPASTCLVTGIMSGSIELPAGFAGFNLTWAHVWFAGAVQFASGAGLITGSFVVTSPLGVACGGPADVTSVGVLAGV